MRKTLLRCQNRAIEAGEAKAARNPPTVAPDFVRDMPDRTLRHIAVPTAAAIGPDNTLGEPGAH